MIQNVWAVLCQRVIENKATNNVSLIEHLERLTVHIPPEHPERFNIALDYTLATLWFNGEENESGMVHVRISVTSPKGSESTAIDSEFKIDAQSFYRWNVNVRAFELRGPGLYRFNLYHTEGSEEEWKQVASVPLLVEYDVDEGASMIEIPNPSRRTAEDKPT